MSGADVRYGGTEQGDSVVVRFKMHRSVCVEKYKDFSQVPTTPNPAQNARCLVLRGRTTACAENGGLLELLPIAVLCEPESGHEMASGARRCVVLRWDVGVGYQMGRFMLRDQGNTIGIGIINDLKWPEDKKAEKEKEAAQARAEAAKGN